MTEPNHEYEPGDKEILAVMREGQLWLIAPPQGDWAENSPLCQHGRHCGRNIISIAKDAYCPICGKGVYLT